MNHREKLLEIYKVSGTVNDVNLPHDLNFTLKKICDSIESQKGVYTVLITLGIHKIIDPNQDIRNHQDNMDQGFSGRSIVRLWPRIKE